jgi:signal transduction histidine kinase
MLRRALERLDRRRLAGALALFFLALAVPTAVLVRHAYGQLELAAFHQQRVLAEEVAARIDARVRELIAREEARSFADYAFLVVEGDPQQSFVQRSPLSVYPVEASIPGLIGHFQIDAQGGFSTPLVPRDAGAGYGVSAQELAERTALQDRIRTILGANRLVQAGAVAAGTSGAADAASDESGAPLEAAGPPGATARPAPRADSARQMLGAEPPEAAAQASFDRLEEADALHAVEGKASANTLGRVEDLKLDPRYQQRAGKREAAPQAAAAPAPPDRRAVRKERVTVPEPAAPAESSPPNALRLATFESDVDPFALGLLDSGHWVLFRRVWREGRRYVQGLLVEQQAFLDDAAATFRASALAQAGDLVIAWRGSVLALYGGTAARHYRSDVGELRGALLYQTHLSPPLAGLGLTFSVTELPPGPGARLLDWLAGILALVLCGGCYLVYRLGAQQIALAQQQQDFVSAVSHELKTPLTSIRMYGEMLRAGWGSEAQKQSYYEYIYEESGRLSRLIHNVLQLARITRNGPAVATRSASGAELRDAIRSKLGSQVESAGYELHLQCDPAAEGVIVQVDPDALLQIVINLVDNAIKFSAGAAHERIDILIARAPDGALRLSVRDYGPGVPRHQARKIFEPFYRSESELTRATAGTGIGLALVRELARAMGARVEVVNREPGAEFTLIFPA